MTTLPPQLACSELSALPPPSLVPATFPSIPQFVAIPELCFHLRAFNLGVSPAWNISDGFFLIIQVSAQKPFPRRGLAKPVYLREYTLDPMPVSLSNPLPSLHLFHSLSSPCSCLCLFSVSCLSKTSVVFYVVRYCLPQTLETYLEYNECK